MRTIAGPKVMERLAPDAAPFQPTRFSLRPQARTLGAIVDGVDMRRPCDPELHRELEGIHPLPLRGARPQMEHVLRDRDA